MRALWTAATGMVSQQLNVDVISNNLANVNTVSYKKERAEFKDLLYDTMERAYMFNNRGRPVNLQVGYGSRVAAVVKDFRRGNFEKTDNPLDLAIDGDAFFMVLGPRGDVLYTKDGSFKIGVSDDGLKLVTSDGYPVLDDGGAEIFLDNVDISRLNISPEGDLSYTDESGYTVPLGQRIGLVKFYNINGLESLGGNLYAVTSASGEPIPDDLMGTRSIIHQRTLETSNVQVVEEMVKLIIAQRAYEINSKAIQSADEMLGQANNLKR